MTDQLLISVSTREVNVARWRGSKVVPGHQFPCDEDGVAAFGEYLARCPRLPVRVVVDAVEEDYRVEALPHSFGGERTEMLTRKLRQYYRSTPYFSAVFQGRDPGKRRDDRFLFCALTNPDLLAPWVDELVKHGIPVAGIYLRPTLSQTLVSRLKIRRDKILLISFEGAGMRLTFLREQKLRVSRLALIEHGAANPTRSYAEEISNTRLYLHGLRILTLDEPLTVLVVDGNDRQADLVGVIARENPNLECRRIGRGELITATGITASQLEASSDALSLHLLGLQAPENNLAPAPVTVGYRRRQARRGLYAMSGAIALLAVAWCGSNWYQILDIHSETGNMARQTSQMQAQYLQATRQFPAAPTTAENLRRSVEISQRIGATLRSPEPMLSIVSQVLNAHPTISLASLGWKYGRNEIDSDPSRISKAAPEIVATGNVANPRRQSGLIEGEVRPFLGDYRQAIDTIEKFASALSNRAEVAEVRIVKLPLNISPDLSLSGNTSESREHSGKADFKLILVMKAAP